MEVKRSQVGKSSFLKGGLGKELRSQVLIYFFPSHLDLYTAYLHEFFENLPIASHQILLLFVSGIVGENRP